jgi:hypothetical protein
VTKAPRMASSLGSRHAAGTACAPHLRRLPPAKPGSSHRRDESRRRAATPSGGPAAASGLTADPAHNRSRSVGSGAARPADLLAAVAVSAPRTADAGRPATAPSRHHQLRQPLTAAPVTASPARAGLLDQKSSQRLDGFGREIQSRRSRAKAKPGKDARSPRSSATRTTEDTARRSACSRDVVAGATGRTQTAASRPAGPTPAGVTTQGR